MAEYLFPRKANPASLGVVAGGKYTEEKSTDFSNDSPHSHLYGNGRTRDVGAEFIIKDQFNPPCTPETLIEIIYSFSLFIEHTQKAVNF